MAPTITSTADYPKEHLSLSHKIRKPIVEKMRRDRINNSIKQLKALLGPQLLKQQTDSKLEKADILEMTVCLLRQYLQPVKISPSSDAASQGFSRCAQEFADFLSKDTGKIQTNEKLQTRFQTLQPPTDEYSMVRIQYLLDSPVHTDVQGKDKSLAKNAPWRPW